MKWPKFNVYDFYMVFVVLILDFYLIQNWNAFDHCVNPLNTWLIVDYNLMFVIKLFFVLKNSGYRKRVKLAVNIFLYVVIFPLTVLWTVLGYLWQEVDLKKSPDTGKVCIPDDMVPWSFFLWLGFTAAASFILFGTLVYEWMKYRKLKRFINKMEMEESLGNNNSSLHSSFSNN